MMPDSKTSLKATQNHPVYSTFDETGGHDVYIRIPDPNDYQPNTPSQIDGVYALTAPFPLLFPEADEELVKEFAAWDAASDEALTDFEKEHL